MGTLEGVAGLLLLCIFLALIAPAVLRLLNVQPPKNLASKKNLANPNAALSPYAKAQSTGS